MIARHDDMLTVNCALAIDLTGQIAVYALGSSVYTGLGGQLAFHLGAFLSKRGRAVTLIPRHGVEAPWTCRQESETPRENPRLARERKRNR